LKVADRWGEVDRLLRKLADRGSSLDLVHASCSSVLRVLIEAGVDLPERPAWARVPARAWPEWAELWSRGIYSYDVAPLPVHEVVRDRGDGRGLPVLAGHRRVARGVLAAGRGRLHPRPDRLGKITCTTGVLSKLASAILT
jgi:hypothetical protein